MTETAAGSPRLFRLTVQWWIVSVGSSFGILLFGTLVVIHNVPIAERFVSAVIAVVLVVFIVKARRAGIEVNETSVTVRRYVGRKTTIPWSEVRVFDLSRNDRGRGRNVLYVAVWVKDGRRLVTQGLQTADQGKGAELVGALEASRPEVAE